MHGNPGVFCNLDYEGCGSQCSQPFAISTTLSIRFELSNGASPTSFVVAADRAARHACSWQLHIHVVPEHFHARYLSLLLFP